MNGIWILVAVLTIVLVVLIAIAFALFLHLLGEQRSAPHAAKSRDRQLDGRTSGPSTGMPLGHSWDHVISSKSMKLINEYGAVMERYAGYSAGVSDRVLPAHPDVIEAALTSAIMANPMSGDQVALELGIMSIANFLPDPDGSRGMTLHESITRPGPDGTVEVDQGKLAPFLMGEEDGDDFVRLTQLVASRSSEKLAIVERLRHTHPGHQYHAGAPLNRAAVSQPTQVASEASRPRVPIQSSNIASVGYDRSSSMLQVDFQDGAHYEYDEAPQRVYDDILASPSAGSYFHRAVQVIYRY